LLIEAVVAAEAEVQVAVAAEEEYFGAREEEESHYRRHSKVQFLKLPKKWKKWKNFLLRN
jgi:hypothetical protein